MERNTLAFWFILIVGVAIYASQGFVVNGWSGTISNALTASFVDTVVISVYFGAAKFFHNYFEELLCIGLLISKDPTITEDSPTQIRRKYDELKRACDVILHEAERKQTD
jgi:hypothetical protein